MKVVGVDINTFYVAFACVESGTYSWSRIRPEDGPDVKAQKPKDREQDASERLIEIWHATLGLLHVEKPDWVYVEDVPFVNSPKVLKHLQSVLTAVVLACDQHGIPCSIINVSTWKRETTGNAKASKTDVRKWARVHCKAPKGLLEDEYDATVIAKRGSVAAGDKPAKKGTKKKR